jgi:hypothetical protein
MEASILSTPRHCYWPMNGASFATAQSPSNINRSRWSAENYEGELVKHCWAEDQFLDSSRRHRSEVIRKKS